MSAEPVAWLEFADHDIINAISPARRRKWIEADPINQAAAKAYPVAAYAHPDPRIAALEGGAAALAFLHRHHAARGDGFPDPIAWRCTELARNLDIA